MRKSKLYITLQYFDKIEQNRFRKYITSPYFNNDQTLVDLFDLLTKEINGDGELDLSKESVWRELNLDNCYNDVRFRKYCSDLLKLIEKFLAQEIYESEPVQQANHLMEAIGKKKIEKLFSSAHRHAFRNIEKQPYRDSNHYFQKYETEKSYASMVRTYLNRASKNNIEEIIQNLDVFYISEKLRLHQEVASLKDNIAYYEQNTPMLDSIADFLENSPYINIPAISIYYQIYRITEDFENESHYFKLKELLGRHSLLFPQEEAYNLYNSAINYCINKINKGNQNFLQELFELSEDLINKEIIFVDNEISPWDFRNIVVTALRLGKYDWTKNFIQNYNDRIPAEYRENAVSFNLATLYFYQKNYDKVIQLLQTIEYEDFSYNLNSKAMLLATYYEMDEIEPLYSLFESFRVYLNRQKEIPENRRRNFKNLIKFTKKLTKVIPGDQKSIEKLKNEIDATKNIASIGWLKEKIAELEG